MVEDVIIWNEVKQRITSKMSRKDFQTMCRLHAMYFNHKYSEPCTCSKSILRLWINQLNNKLI